MVLDVNTEGGGARAAAQGGGDPLAGVVVERGARVAEAPAVTVIVPCYNVAQYVAEALDSVMRQTFDNYECIVVNDGSADTEELERALAPYRERVVYVRQENRGLSGARNTAIRISRASLIALLDADDAWEPRYLEVQVGMMERDPSITVLYPNARIFGDAPDAGRTFMEVCPSEGEPTLEALLDGRCIVFIGSTVRREAVERAGMFDEEQGRYITEDFDLWLRILQQGGRIAYHREVLARYRRRADQITADYVAVNKRVLRVLDKVERTFDLSPAERGSLERQRARCLAERSLHEGKRAFFDGDTAEAIAKLTEANAHLKSRKVAAAVVVMRLSPGLLRGLCRLRDHFAPASGRARLRETMRGAD